MPRISRVWTSALEGSGAPGSRRSSASGSATSKFRCSGVTSQGSGGSRGDRTRRAGYQSSSCQEPCETRGVSVSAGLLLWDAAGEQLEVRVDHQPDELIEAGARLPAELLLRLRVVADQVIDLGRPVEGRVGAHVVVGVQPDLVERDIDEVAHAVRLTGRDHVVLRLALLEHEPHRLDVVLRVAPVALGIEVAEPQLLLEAELDGGRTVGDLARHELEPATWAFVIEQNPGGREEVVALAVVDRDE